MYSALSATMLEHKLLLLMCMLWEVELCDYGMLIFISCGLVCQENGSNSCI